MMESKCKIIDLVHDLVEVYNITEIGIDVIGVGACIADSLEQRGVKVKRINKWKKNKRLDPIFENLEILREKIDQLSLENIYLDTRITKLQENKNE